MKPFRKLVILLLSVSCSIMAYAQKEYDSLLKEGKVWTMSYKATLNPEVYPDLYHYSKMMLHGDTLISEIPFKQIYEKGLTDNLEDESAEWKATRQFVGEKDGRIFYLNGDYSVNPIGVMDFSLNVSDVFDGDKNSILELIANTKILIPVVHFLCVALALVDVIRPNSYLTLSIFFIESELTILTSYQELGIFRK